MEDHEKRIMKVKIQLQNSHPFLSYMLMHMHIEPSEAVPTMCVTNKGNIYYSPTFVNSLTLNQAKGVLAHEALHMVLGHVFRCTKWYKEYQELLNWCADLIVNGLLMKEGFELTEGCICPDKNGHFTYTDKDGNRVTISDVAEEESLESLFMRLKDDLPVQRVKKFCAGSCSSGSGEKDGDDPSGGGSGRNEGEEDRDLKGKGFDEHRYEKDESADSEPSKPGDISEDWKFRITEAASVAKQRGKLSGTMASVIDFITESQVDWRTKLARFIIAALPANASWNRPSRRSNAIGVYLPHTIKEEHVDAIVHVDTSGSIADEELRVFLSEMVGILSSYDSVDLTMIQCDSEIREVRKLERDEDFSKFVFKGRGGTSHRDVVDWVNNNTEGKTVLISCTDGYSDIESCYPALKDNCSTMFVVVKGGYSKSIESFGEILEIDSRRR